jgi:hypothetical protein
MAKLKKPEPSQAINLVYIRAAILANTGVKLTLEEVRRYLVEEKIITPKQAVHNAQIFRGYSDYFGLEDYSVELSREDDSIF